MVTEYNRVIVAVRENFSDSIPEVWRLGGLISRSFEARFLEAGELG